MPLTVRQLLARLAGRAGELPVLAGAERLDRTVRWAHVIELEDPGRWLEGDEVVLTTGLGLPHDEWSHRAYVGRLVAAGVAALGFGVGLSYDVVPPALVAEAQARGLTLFEVPRPVPFIAITREVAARIAAEHYESVQRAVEATARLTRAALERGTPGVLARLVAVVPGWALALDAQGRLLSAQPPDAARHVPSVAREVARTDATARFAISVIAPEGQAFSIQTLGTGDRPLGFLAVGHGAAPGAFERLVVNHAASLVSLELEKSSSLRVFERALRADLLRTLVVGGLAETEAAEHLAGFGLPATGPVAVLLVRVTSRGGAVEVVEEALFDLGAPFLLWARDDDLVVLLSGDVAATADAVWKRTGPALRGARAGLGGPVSPARVRTSLTQASYALQVGGAAGLTRFAEVGTYALLLGAHSRDGLVVIADALLAPLEEYDRCRRGDLVRSLREFLAANAQAEPAATRLGVHRHTLRHRMAKVEELTGRSLASAQDRTEFWLALQARELADSTS